ncbi:MAG: DUF4340 domain-containing protein [Akkermansia sp.]|nr:DUF4340 domain-containing protein [Akkermansia sp.]
MRIIYTIALALLAAAITVLAVFQTVDGNLSRITGIYRFRDGMPLFPGENTNRLHDVSWMRIADLHDKIECERDAMGVWWIRQPFVDRMAPSAVQAILDFTANAKVVSSLERNEETKKYMREYGVETSPIHITLKVPQGGKDDFTTVARYTMGNTSPWLSEVEDSDALIPTTYLRTNFYGRDKRVHVVSGNILNHFKNGLMSLRDPRPLLFEQEQLHEITLSGAEQVLQLKRTGTESWSILTPVITAADSEKVNRLIQGLKNLTAVRVEDPDAVKLPEKPQLLIRLMVNGYDKPIELALYPPFRKEAGDQLLCYATVNDRQAVFTLQADRKVLRKGSYSNLINAICDLPVLPDKALAQVRLQNSTTYTNELPLSLEQLRSLQFANVDAADVSRVVLRTSNAVNGAIRLMMVPGDKDSQVGDTWLYAASGEPFRTADSATVLRFLKGLSEIPVQEVVADAAPGDDMGPLKHLYGLHEPRYIIYVLPRPCVVRATLFGHDLPLVKDRSPRIFIVRRHPDPNTGRMAWFGMEEGSNSICRLSTKFTRLLALRPEKWKNRQVLSFPISAVRKLTLGFQQAPLELEFDYIDESWKGCINGEDVTPRVNPHRATHYIRNLLKLKVNQWLEYNDAEALAALQNPVFSVRLELAITDYSDAETSVVEQQNDSENGSPEDMLTETDEFDRHLRELALTERKTRKETRTLEISPAQGDSNKPFFYGRITETGELFILSFEDAQGLAGDIIDM